IASKYEKLRQLLAQANLEVAQSLRTIDDTPTRTELIQYERRFVELYQQSAWKLEDTRKYYDMYNTLDTTLSFLKKEVKLLNSISETFHEAMKSAASKGEFSKQFEGIELVEEQRRYYKAVKDFQQECDKNDWLAAKLEQTGRK
ncbi:hypothetical protein B484DRAFT_410977, partial [Ochromonadaceae sp. CCMP2298]